MARRILSASVAFLIAGLLLLSWRPVGADQPKTTSEFSSSTIDLGVVVSDVEKSAKFYTETIGFKEVPGFQVPADFATAAGLTDNQPLKVRVFVLGEGASATKLKLIELPGTKPSASNNQYIHSQLGFRYLTIFVADTNAAVARLNKTGVKPIGKGTLGLPDPLPRDVFLTIVRDPDGNMVELVGPKK